MKKSLARKVLPIPLLLLVLAAGVGLAQEEEREMELNAYKVAPVYPPPLERPAIDVAKEQLPDGTAGRFPSFDGERFRLSLGAGGEEQTSADGARQLLDQLLGGLGWRLSPDSLKEVPQETRPAADAKRLEEHLQKLGDESRKRIEGRFGELSEAAEASIREQEEIARRQASENDMSVFRYQQMHDGIPVENTSLRLVWRQGRGFTSLSGRVFTQIQIDNARKLDEQGGARAAGAPVERFERLAEAEAAKAEAVLLPYASSFRHSWKAVVETADGGAYEVWVDAESGEVLQLLPMFSSDDGSGLVFDPDPNGATQVLDFAVDGPSGGNYKLKLASVMDISNSGADGVCSGDLTVPSGSGSADFNVSPINGTVVDRTGSTGYNCRFQDVNVYGWVHSHLDQFTNLLGSTALPELSLTTNHNNPCGFGIDNACASWGSWSLTFGIGSATIGTTTSCNAVFNGAVDSTVVTHEFGHLVNHRNISGSVPGHVDEGLSDFWAYTMFDTDTFGDFWGANCAAASQGGWTPRQVEAQDVFPEHLALSSSQYGHGQMLGWALWNTRRGLSGKSSLGVYTINSSLIDALSAVSFGLTNSDEQIHDNFVNILEELADELVTSSLVHKVFSGFARAGLFLSARDAIVDIDDDYLDRDDATGPTFTVWTGRDYTFNAAGSVNTGSQPFNTRFEIEVANDENFTTNLRSSGVQSGVVAAAGGTATWTLPAADWTALRAADYLYYRVRTTNASGGNERRSANPGNGTWTGVPPAYAVINDSGECECTCGASAAAPPGSTFVTLLPVLLALAWMMHLRRKPARLT